MPRVNTVAPRYNEDPVIKSNRVIMNNKRRHVTLFSNAKVQVFLWQRRWSQQIAVLKRMKKLLPLKLRENLYRAFIAPHFNYCAESWHFCGNCITEKLEKQNEGALRFVYQDKISPYETLIVKNGYSTLANQRLAKMLSTVFRAIGNGNLPTSISELLTARNSDYNLCGDAV